MEISGADLLRMKESLGIVRDNGGGVVLLHNLINIVVIGLSVALCGWTDVEHMEALGQERTGFFKGLS